MENTDNDQQRQANTNIEETPQNNHVLSIDPEITTTLLTPEEVLKKVFDIIFWYYFSILTKRMIKFIFLTS